MSEYRDLFGQVVAALREEGIEGLLIGGMAVNHYGFTRGTADMDLMLAVDQAAAARTILVRLGFENVIESETAILFQYSNQPIRVDVLKVDDDTLRELLGRSKMISTMGQQIAIPALDDLIAMKFFAAQHGGMLRRTKDMLDIAQLALMHKLDLHDRIRPLALQFGDESLFEEVEKLIEAENKDETAED